MILNNLVQDIRSVQNLFRNDLEIFIFVVSKTHQLDLQLLTANLQKQLHTWFMIFVRGFFDLIYGLWLVTLIPKELMKVREIKPRNKKQKEKRESEKTERKEQGGKIEHVNKKDPKTRWVKK